MLLTALLGIAASLFLVIWVKLGCLLLSGTGSRDLGVASFDPTIPDSLLMDLRLLFGSEGILVTEASRDIWPSS